jgi:biopolymer transport protein ExbD
MIAFFFITTKMSTPAVADLYTPESKANVDLSNEIHKYSLLLLKTDVYAYENDINKGKKFNYNEINNFIKNEKGKDSSIAFIIKPAKDATYKRTIDILDQMTINNIKKYNLLELTKEEENFIAQH